MLREFIKVDDNGKVLGKVVLDDSEEIPPNHFLGWGERKFHDPNWDFTLNDWVEGLSPAEVEQREEEYQKEINKPDESNMISLAILELAVEMDKIKEGMK